MALNSHVGAELKCGSEQQEHLGCGPSFQPPLSTFGSELTIFDFAFSPYFNFFILNYVYVDMGVWMHMNKGLLEARRVVSGAGVTGSSGRPTPALRERTLCS